MKEIILIKLLAIDQELGQKIKFSFIALCYNKIPDTNQVYSTLSSVVRRYKEQSAGVLVRAAGFMTTQQRSRSRVYAEGQCLPRSKSEEGAVQKQPVLMGMDLLLVPT